MSVSDGEVMGDRMRGRGRVGFLVVAMSMHLQTSREIVVARGEGGS